MALQEKEVTWTLIKSNIDGKSTLTLDLMYEVGDDEGWKMRFY